ncbi:MAG: hypothetical protein MZV70_71730 [Desulfobacterales bacterium]|nr:hypothetical protein [Desulfobacterales bacterium]
MAAIVNVLSMSETVNHFQEERHEKIAIGFIVLISVLALVWVGAAGAADFPSKRITYNICFNPGGESDITARFQEAAAEEGPRRRISPSTTRSAAAGPSAGRTWSRAKPDGYTIAGHNLPHIVLQPMEMGNAGYKTLDLKQHLHVREHPERPARPRSTAPTRRSRTSSSYAKKPTARRRHGRRQRHLVRERPGHHHAQQGGRHPS